MSITREQKKDMLRRQIAELNDTSVDCMMATYELQHLDLEDALSASVAENIDLRRDRERLRSALRRARDWSVSSHGYECRQSIIMAEWIDGGMVGDLPPLPAYLSAAMPAPLPECVQPGKETGKD